MLNLSEKDKQILAIGLTAAAIFVILGVFVFSYSMETLDVQAEELGAQESSVYQAPFPDYMIPDFENEVGSILLGILSTLAIFGVALGVGALLKKSKFSE